MGITTKQFLKKPLYVEAVRISRKNFADVAKWCDGHVQTERADAPQNAGKRFIKVETHNPINVRQTKAFVGDWLLKTERGCKIYTHKSFTESFDEVVELEPSYPYSEGDVIVLGPECFIAKDGSAMHWKGANYVPQDADLTEDDLDSCAIHRVFDPGVPQ